MKMAPTPERKAQLVAQTQERIKQIDAVLKSVKWAPDKGADRSLSEQERKVEVEFNDWLGGIRSKLETLKKDMQFGTTLIGEDLVQKMTQMNLQFLALQEATQMESRRFKTLSNASKARHDLALNSIRNMK